METPPSIALGASALLGYLIGSVNFAVIVARRHGVDILSAGSGNPGATNVKRVLGKGPGNLVFALDALKGAAGAALGYAVAYALYLLPLFRKLGQAEGASQGAPAPGILGKTLLQQLQELETSILDPGKYADLDLVFAITAAGFVGVLLGHCFSCFLRLRGGKGVASTIGGLLVLLPIPIVIGAAIWGLVFALTRYVSLASIALGVSLPLSCWLLPLATPLRFGPAEFWFAAALAAFNVWTHRSNLGRLLAGTENRFGHRA